MIEPHGGRLVTRVAPEGIDQDYLNRLKKVPIGEREVSDLELIAVGAYSPLEGFMGHGDYNSVLKDMRLADGLPWSLPITLSVSRKEGEGLREGEDLALVDLEGEVRGIIHLEEKYPYDKELEARLVYRTTDPAHPGVRALYLKGDILLGGKITLLKEPQRKNRYHLHPFETRRTFAERGWNSVVGFQTRNPVHRAHEYIIKCALEVVDGLLLHPLVGQTKEDDVPAEVRLGCYLVLMEHCFPKERVVLALLPAAMRYAGPREAIFHAIVRKNYGCTHFIVGRDHAGVGNYYGPYDAQNIFKEFTPEELGITPLFFENAFYCKRCQGMATIKTCPHGAEDRVILSGTKLREMLNQGLLPPEEITRPEVAQILIESLSSDEGLHKVHNS